MRHSLSMIMFTILLAFTSGCGGGSGNQDSDTWLDPGIIHVSAYMPYVEEVILPEQIYAGEEFTLTLRVSSALEPRLLNGDVPRKLRIVGPGVNPALPNVVRFTTWMRDNLPEGPAPESAEFVYPAWTPLKLPAGEWFIGVQTAKTRELGGVFVEHAPLDDLSSWDEHYTDPQTGRTNFVEYRLYPVTVIERPGA
jgi:hypothetical protein